MASIQQNLLGSIFYSPTDCVVSSDSTCTISTNTYQQYANVQYGQLGGGYGSFGLAQYGGQMSLPQQVQQAIGPVKKKFSSLIESLRDEIKSWHGDVLKPSW